MSDTIGGHDIHQLKILPEYFQAVWNGTKRFELRKNDRDYKVGDILALREWDGEKYTGSGVAVRVIYILKDFPDGLCDGWCVMSIVKLSDGGR